MKIRAPGIRLRWLLLSLFVNAAVLAVVLPITLSDRESGEPVVKIDPASEPPPLREEVKPAVRETKPIEQEERVIEDPVVKDAKVSDHNETDNDLPFEESLGKKDFLSDAPFDGPSTNAAIGIGGGAGGAFGGRAGHRNVRAEGGGSLSEQGGAEPAPTDREGYDAVEEEGFMDPRRSPLSTFSIDVDTASYANVRRILREGRRPPAGAVRIEEMLNYFSYGYRAPASGEPFAVTTEVGPCPWAPAHRLVHIGVQGRRVPANEIPPRNLVFLLDVSGSMRSADKLPLVVSAMKLLTDQLSSADRVAIVVYAGASGLVLPSTPGSAKGDIFDALSRLRAGGSTNGGQGIRLAYQIARENRIEGGINRVILATDGDFNVGTTSRSDLTDLIEKERESGVFLTVLGVGRGNVQDSQMEMLADRGNGNYAYLDTIDEAGKVLVRELGGTLVTIAKDVKIQVEFNPARVGGYRLVGYENRRLAARDFNDDGKDAGEIGAGHSVTALYEILPPGEQPETGEVDSLEYQKPSAEAAASASNDVLMLKLRYKEPEGTESRLVTFRVSDPGRVALAGTSVDFQFAAAVATFGLALRDSPYRGDASPALAEELAAPALGDDPDGLRREFLDLCRTAR